MGCDVTADDGRRYLSYTAAPFSPGLGKPSTKKPHRKRLDEHMRTFHLQLKEEVEACERLDVSMRFRRNKHLSNF
jgi:hypothetical protein